MRGKVITSVFVLAWVIILLFNTYLRLIFPWDLFIWSESPFMTNMLKLFHGLPIFTSPLDANSFIYSPGLHYLVFFILKPFGLELDVRYCRLIVILCGVLSAFVCAKTMLLFVRQIVCLKKTCWFFGVSLGVSALVVFQNYTADMAHTDNLHILHAVLVFFLTYLAVIRRNYFIALLSILIAALGGLTKQTSSLSILGPIVVYAILNPWGWFRFAILAGIGGVCASVILFWIFSPEYAFFFLYKLLFLHPIDIRRIFYVDNLYLWGVLPILVLLFFYFLWKLQGEKGRFFLLCWGCTGLFMVLPSFLGLLKVPGWWNNLIIIKLWFLLLVWPCLIYLPKILVEIMPQTNKLKSKFFNVVQVALVLSIVIPLYPKKMLPSSKHYEYCQKVENNIKKHIKENSGLLVAHGTMYLIRSGFKGVPLDRANTMLELWFGEKNKLAGFESRIKAQLYDIIYYNISGENWYGGDLYQINKTIADNYYLYDTFAIPYLNLDLGSGYQSTLMNKCIIFKPYK